MSGIDSVTLIQRKFKKTVTQNSDVKEMYGLLSGLMRFHVATDQTRTENISAERRAALRLLLSFFIIYFILSRK